MAHTGYTLEYLTDLHAERPFLFGQIANEVMRIRSRQSATAQAVGWEEPR